MVALPFCWRLVGRPSVVLVSGPSQGAVLSDVGGRAAAPTGVLSWSLAGLATPDRERRGAMRPARTFAGRKFGEKDFLLRAAAKLFTVGFGVLTETLLAAGGITLEHIPAAPTGEWLRKLDNRCII